MDKEPTRSDEASPPGADDNSTPANTTTTSTTTNTTTTIAVTSKQDDQEKKEIDGGHDDDNKDSDDRMLNRENAKGDGPKKSLTFRQRCGYLTRSVTIEPMVAFYFMPKVLAGLATQNLNLEKACKVNLGYSEEVCMALAARNTTGLAAEETAVQQLVASMQIWKSALHSFFPALLIVFIGAWSDRTGLRKPCMMLPIVGEFLTSISLLACTYWFYELPMEAAGLIEALWPAVTGGWFTMIMGTFSYVGDITTVESRTVRVGIVNSFLSLGVPVGMALSGVLYVKLGFYGVFGIAAGCYVFSFMYGLFVVKESPRAKEIKLAKKSAPEKLPKLTCCGKIQEFFAPRHVRDTYDVAFGQANRNRRRKILVLMLIIMVLFSAHHGEVMYLFMRYRFKWNEIQFSLFSTYNIVVHMTGNLLAVVIFSHFFKMDDGLLGVVGCMSKILASFVYAFSTTDVMIYMAPLVEIFSGATHIVMRSITTKLVPPDELGKINSLFGVWEAIIPLGFGPMYSFVYRATVKTFPGAFFLVTGGLMIPGVFAFGWLYMEHKKQEALENQQKLQLEEMKKQDKIVEDKTSATEKVNQDKQTKILSEIAGVDNIVYESEKL